MDILIIASLMFLGLVLVIAEILLLPGITIAAIGAFASFIVAIVLGYLNYGLQVSLLILFLSIVLSVITLILCLRRKNLSKISLSSIIDSKVSSNLSESLNIGDEGIAHTRLAPMGSVMLGGNIYEARSYEGYIHPKTKIYVIGYDDNVVIVSVLKKHHAD